MAISVQDKHSISSDIIHNRNCHSYLLQLKIVINKHIIDLNQPFLASLTKVNEVYNELFPYGNLYSEVISALEEQIESLYLKANPEQTEALNNLILAIYHNDNHILDHSVWINGIGTKTRPTQTNTSELIEHTLEDRKALINKISPNTVHKLTNRISELFSLNFKPQLDTNLPSLKNYSHRKNTSPAEYRFSTQAQRHNGEVRISPLFKRWLAIKAQKSLPTQKVSHIYFNNLGLNRDDFDIPGSKEKYLSLALHELENDPSLKIAVITLPASKSLMGADHYKMVTDRLLYASVFKELIEIAVVEKHESGVSDFRISTKTRTQLFGTHANQLKTLTRLLTNSFQTLGINSSDFISTAQKQAVWFHFTKFELTDYIITTLNPDGFNFTCKDAIDRGAVSSAYFNLLKSFQSEQPIQREEFERALDSAAANVKGRGMNFHRKIIWNILDKYVNTHYADLIKSDKKSWLIFWRDMNCPHSSVNPLLKTRISQFQEQLNSLTLEQSALKKAGNKLIIAISEQYERQVSGQRLLLELVSRTTQLLTNTPPSLHTIQSYKSLAKELKIKHPLLNIVGGLAEVFLGILLYLPSFGYSNSLIINGIATSKAGLFASQRTQLSEDSLAFSKHYTSAVSI